MLDQGDTLPKRLSRVLRAEGIKGISKRIEGRLRSKWSRSHVLVFSQQFGSVSDALEFPARLDPSIVLMLERCQRLLSSLTFKQVTESDGGEIDELTGIDPWGHSREGIFENLQEGWCCYVAKIGSRIVASSWIKAGPEFYEPLFKRSFTLGGDEVYTWRTFCVPDWRTRGVVPMLSKWIVNHLASTEGIKKYTGYVLDNNVGQKRTLGQMGWSVVGRLGFIEIFGVRFHYIWGRGAFRATKKRFLIRG